MRRIVIVVIFLFVVSTAKAQVTIQHGKTLSELIQNLYGGDGIQLKNTGHQAHFGDSREFQTFSETLQRVLQSRPLFPLPSAVGLVSYRFNEQTGTYERIQGSLGPLLADRGVTTGKGTFTLSATYSFSDFDQVNGADTIDITLRHCRLFTCFGADPNAPFLDDTIRVTTRFRLKSQALALSTVYGVTDNFDLGLVVPYIRNDVTVMTNARIIVGPRTVPPLPHEFDLNVETPGQFGTASAIGIGDIVARAKWRFLPKKAFDTAVLADVSLPTGEKENFFGTGEVRTKVTLVASKSLKSLIPHINLGYEVNFGDTKLNTIDYRVGTEYAMRQSLTLSGEILGIVRPSAQSLFRLQALDGQSLVGRSEIDGAIGGKWQLSPNRAFLFNVIVPLNNSGIRASSMVTAGIQAAM